MCEVAIQCITCGQISSLANKDNCSNKNIEVKTGASVSISL